MATRMLRVLSDVVIPLRDGTSTSAELWLGHDDEPRPALLLRTPYPKEFEVVPPLFDARALVQAGYCLVIHDVRGTGASGGEFEPFVTEGPDGADAVAWVAAQPWCDGRVAMLGASYCGAVQWLAAAERPPALKAIAPMLAADNAAEGWSFNGGHREHGLLSTWIAASLARPADRRAEDVAAAARDPGAVAEIAPWSAPWFTEDAASSYWARLSPQRDAVETPAFVVGGWYDAFIAGTLRSFARDHHEWSRLVIGPWGHHGSFSHLVGDADLGAAGDGGVMVERLHAFLSAVLDGREPPGPRVLAYVLGRRAWLEAPRWPPPGTEPRSLELVGGGEIVVDPNDLPPTSGGRGLLVGVPGLGWGVRDQRAFVTRDDVLMLSVPTPSDEPTLLAGPMSVRLSVSASGGAQRDWVAVLCFETDNGMLANLCEGATRQAVETPEIVIGLGDVCLQIPAGTTLRLIVAGGWWPRWAPIDTPGSQHVVAGVLEITTLGTAVASIVDAQGRSHAGR
jgi:putative CocE/NonD family hydrolase